MDRYERLMSGMLKGLYPVPCWAGGHPRARWKLGYDDLELVGKGDILMSMTRIGTFAEFWLYYLREHGRQATRALHYAGTTLVIMSLVAGIVTGNWRFFVLMPICGYLFAWLAHFMVERNRPATFRYPLWSLAADFLMYSYWLSGRMGRELDRAGVPRR
jgi:hypothetical protein